MIKTLTMHGWAKHQGRTFNFADGMNKIIGENEAGKSLIFEAIDFCFHGSQALRLPVGMYGNGLKATITFSVRDTEYVLERGLKVARLEDVNGKTLASGNTAVTNEVRKIFGYSRNVFMTSNYSSQDSIQHLSKMTPAERKRTIDNVIGLTAVEQVLKDRKDNLTLIRRERDALKNREVIAPEALDFDFNPDWDVSIAKYKADIKTNADIVATQMSLSHQHKSIDAVKPAEIKLLSEVGLIQGKTYEELQETEIQISKFSGRLAGWKDLHEKHLATFVTIMAEPDLSNLIEGVTAQLISQKQVERATLVNQIELARKKVESLPDLSGLCAFTDEEIDQVKKQFDLHNEWLTVKNLKAQGSVTCTNCACEVYLAAATIKEKYSHVPDHVDKPELTPDLMLRENRRLAEAQEIDVSTRENLSQLQEQLHDFDMDWHSATRLELHLQAEHAQAVYEENVREVERYKAKGDEIQQGLRLAQERLDELQKDWFTEEQLAAHRLASRNKVENDKYRTQLATWQASKDALQPFDENLLEETRKAQELTVVALEEVEDQVKTWTLWKEKNDKHVDWLAEYTVVEFRMAEENLAVEALNVFKNKIKTTILPSVNRVASTWMCKMSEGKHTKVELTDDMTILVGDAPIEALSVSGKALGHLSLRMALGQVLTNSVFPVFMADEVDASMRDGRAQNVLDALTEMLKGSMKQVILISHRELEHVENTIEV